MPMKPKEGESQSDFMSRCVPEMIGEGDDKRPREQAVAACLNIWRNRDKNKKQMEPREDEDRADFMDRCTLEEDPSTCAEIWAEWEGAAIEATETRTENGKQVVHKTIIAKKIDGEYILSDATVDRFGDIIEPGGWDVRHFNKNPVALFNHDSNFPIGKWTNVRVEKAGLRGKLEYAQPGTSARIDEIRSLVEQGILKAVSVGFVAGDAEPIDKTKNKGMRFKKQELLECSLVSVPANPNALAVAKSLNISRATKELVFGKSAAEKTAKSVSDPGKSAAGRTTNSGKSAEDHSSKRNTKMPSSISKRIEDAQTKVNNLRDQLERHLETYDDDAVDQDTALQTTTELNAQIEKQMQVLESLRQAEARLARTAEDTKPQTVTKSFGNSPRIFAAPAQKIKPADHIWRGLTVAVKHFVDGRTRPIDEILKETYGENDTSTMTRAVMRGLITRAASAPADTTTSGWAAELVTTAYADFMDQLVPAAVYPKLAAKGNRFTFGRNGIVTIPYREATPALAGAFVLQGNPIPVKQGSFNALTLTPKKMGIISAFTRELAEHSTPSIEQLIRTAVIEDTSVAIDTVLLDANAATATRPAGIRNGVTPTTPTGSGNPIDKFLADTRNLINVLNTSSFGNLRSPVWIMSPGDLLVAATLQTTTGDTPFREELAGNTLFGIPIITSTNTPSDLVILLDAADFVSAAGDTPNFSVTDTATLHFEDTTPLQIATGAQGSGVLATPVRSMFQTDSLAVRMVMDLNWALRRSGMVATVVPGWNP
jgi:HK97 family phage prohead protease/HK97 family phage major capsid protein